MFGSSGDLGIRRDGTHATHLAGRGRRPWSRSPPGISLEEAAGIGVPFVTALEGFRRAGLPQPGETVLVLGLNGKVGQAAAQIATWRGARVIGVVRKAEPYAGHANGPVAVIDSSADGRRGAGARADRRPGRGPRLQHGGRPLLTRPAPQSLAMLGRQIFIAAVDRIVEFDIFAFYRGRHTYVGHRHAGLSSVETAPTCCASSRPASRRPT